MTPLPHRRAHAIAIAAATSETWKRAALALMAAAGIAALLVAGLPMLLH